jgi:hypothetical protein
MGYPEGPQGFGMGYVSRFAVSRSFLDLSSAKTSQHSCSAGQAACTRGEVRSRRGTPLRGWAVRCDVDGESLASALRSSLSPQANALCERLIGTLRRECFDWIIPLTEDHLRRTLWSWLPHYNHGRPHRTQSSVPRRHCPVQVQRQRHRFERPSRVVADPVLNGLHHEYSRLPRAA